MLARQEESKDAKSFEFLGRTATAGALDLSGIDLSNPLTVLKLVKQLQHHPQINSLILAECAMTSEGANLLSFCDKVTFLNLSNNYVLGDQWLEAFDGNHILQDLILVNDSIGARGAAFLTRLSGLRTLNLNVNRIGDAGAAALTRCLNLTTLMVCNNGIQSEGAERLAAHPKLRHLDIRYNLIEDKAALSLLEAKNLVKLDIRYNYVSQEVVHRLSDKFATTSRSGAIPFFSEPIYEGRESKILTVFGRTAVGDCLDISGVNFRANSDLIRLLEFLDQFPNITTVILKNCQLEHIETGWLVSNKTLKMLDVSGYYTNETHVYNLTQITALQSLAISVGNSKAIKHLVNSRLKSLSLLDGWIDSNRLAEFVKGNFVELDLRHNHIKAEGARLLAECPTLTALNISLNNIGSEGVRYLANSASLRKLICQNVTQYNWPERESLDVEAVQALVRNEKLTYLDLSHNAVSHPKRFLENRVLMTFISDNVSWRVCTDYLGGYEINDPFLMSRLKNLGIRNQKMSVIPVLLENDLHKDLATIVGDYINDYDASSEYLLPKASLSITWFDRVWSYITCSKEKKKSELPSQTKPNSNTTTIINAQLNKTTINTVATPLLSDVENNQYYESMYAPVCIEDQSLQIIYEKCKIEEVEAKENVSYLQLVKPLLQGELLVLIDHIQQKFPQAKVEELEGGRRIKILNVSHDELLHIISPSTINFSSTPSRSWL